MTTTHKQKFRTSLFDQYAAVSTFYSTSSHLAGKLAGTPLAHHGPVAATERQDLVARAITLTASVMAVCRRLGPTGPMYIDLARQLFRATSAIGANLEEGKVAHSRRDMAAKFTIALRESREAAYWLRLLERDDEWRTDVAPLLKETNEFVAMLTTSVRKLRSPDADRTP